MAPAIHKTASKSAAFTSAIATPVPFILKRDFLRPRASTSVPARTRATFSSGQPSAQRPQAMHSPAESESESGNIATGQPFLQRPQFFAQWLFLRENAENGSTGISENSAPKGQRNWQKKRSTNAMPTTMAASMHKAPVETPSMDPATMAAKAVHGL